MIHQVENEREAIQIMQDMIQDQIDRHDLDLNVTWVKTLKRNPMRFTEGGFLRIEQERGTQSKMLIIGLTKPGDANPIMEDTISELWGHGLGYIQLVMMDNPVGEPFGPWFDRYYLESQDDRDLEFKTALECLHEFHCLANGTIYSNRTFDRPQATSEELVYTLGMEWLEGGYDESLTTTLVLPSKTYPKFGLRFHSMGLSQPVIISKERSNIDGLGRNLPTFFPWNTSVEDLMPTLRLWRDKDQLARRSWPVEDLETE